MCSWSRSQAAFCSLFLLLAPLAEPSNVTPKRQYEIYSSVRDHGDDLLGTELDLLVWEDTVDATLTIYERFVDRRPIHLHGAVEEDQISVSAAQGEELLEIRGRRLPDHFAGEMTYKRKGQIVRSFALDLPRKKLK